MVDLLPRLVTGRHDLDDHRRRRDERSVRQRTVESGVGHAVVVGLAQVERICVMQPSPRARATGGPPPTGRRDRRATGAPPAPCGSCPPRLRRSGPDPGHDAERRSPRAQVGEARARPSSWCEDTAAVLHVRRRAQAQRRAAPQSRLRPARRCDTLRQRLRASHDADGPPQRADRPPGRRPGNGPMAVVEASKLIEEATSRARRTPIDLAAPSTLHRWQPAITIGRDPPVRRFQADRQVE